jgi:hypothetical protein
MPPVLTLKVKAGGMEEMTVGISEIFKSVSEISVKGVENSDNIRSLEELINRFKM